MHRSMDERLLLTSFKFVQQKQYWEAKLSGLEEIAGAKPVQTREKPNLQTHQANNESVEIAIPAALCARILELSNQSELTVYIVLMAALNVLLYRYAGVEDIALLSPVYEPNVMEDTLNRVVVIRDRLQEGMSFKDLLLQLSRSVREAYENQDYPFTELMQKMFKNSDLQPVSSIACLLTAIHDAGKISDAANPAQLVFAFNLNKTEKHLDGKIGFAAGAYERAYLTRLAAHYRNLLEALIDDIHTPVAAVYFLTGTERQQLLYDFNNYPAAYPQDRLIHELFEAQAKISPDHIALIGPRQSAGPHALTYRELNEKSNRLAHYLVQRGFQPRDLAGIMTERSVAMVIGILALLKAGGTYVPIDPTYPAQRVMVMLEGSGAALVLTHSSRLLQGPNLPGNLTLLPLDRLEEELSRQPVHNPTPLTCPEDLFYVIFTSGSTGTPKGAGVYQRGFMNLLHWFTKEFALNAADRNLLITSMSFDLTQKSLYAPLTTGGVLSLPGVDYFDPGALVTDIRNHWLTWVNCTPGIFSRLVEYELAENGERLSSLRYVFLGGEPVSAAELIQWWESSHCNAEIVNMYGPTECTDISAFYTVKDLRRFLNGTVPAGRPISNTKLYILDNHLQLLPAGIPGELLIGGAGVGPGYVNDKKLTAEKFIRLTGENQPHGLLYRSGDLAKWLPDGNIEFIGRLDHQVKIRGFRIELGEIEAQLLNHHAIKQAVVTVYTPGKNKAAAAPDNSPLPWENKCLCAYFVAREKITDTELKEQLSRHLAPYMIPTYFIPLETLPLSPNGKIDRNALPDPEQFARKNEATYIAPENQLEKILANTWKEVLNLEKIGVNDNFFNVGGNSLEIGRLISKLKEALNQDIEFITLFRYPTIRALAQHLATDASEDPPPGTNPRGNEIKQAQQRMKQRMKKSKAKAASGGQGGAF